MATATKDMKKKAVKKRTRKATATKDSFVPTLIAEDEIDPRHITFEAWYTNPESPTFSNALRSAVKAGYTLSYAKNIMHHRPKWLSDIVGRMEQSNLVHLAREMMHKHMTMDLKEQAMGAFGPLYEKDEDGNKKPIYRISIQKMEIQQKTGLFIAQQADPLFNKTKKDGDGIKVDIKQIIIIAPNGSNNGQNGSEAYREAVSSVSSVTE